MILSAQQKQSLKNSLVSSLCREEEIRRIVIFGSFVRSDCPEDMDVAVFQDSDAPYLDLAMKYRGRTRDVSRQIPLDIIPLRHESPDFPFMREIESGETVYER